MKNKFVITALGLIMLFFFISASRNICNFFYGGHNGFIGSHSGVLALNFMKHGFINTKFCPILAPLSETVPSNPESYYVGHPMLFRYLLSLYWRVVTPSEASGSILMLLFMAGMFLFIFLLVRDLTRNNALALVSIALLSIMPTVQYTGKQINSDIAILFFIAAQLYFFLKYLNNKNDRHLSWLISFTFLGCLVEWPAYISTVYISLYFLITKPKDKKAFFFAIGSMLLAFFLFLLPAFWARGSFDKIISNFFFRFGQGGARPALVPFLMMILERSDYHFGNLLSALLKLSLLYVFYLPVKFFVFKKKQLGDLFFLLWLLIPATYYCIFMQQIQIHDYFTIYLAPYLSFSIVWITYNILGYFHKSEKLKKIVMPAIFAVIIVWTVTHYNLANRFGVDESYHYPQLGKLLEGMTTAKDKILLQVDLPDRHFMYYYFRREINDNFPVDLGSIEKIAKSNPHYKLVVLDTREQFYPTIRELLQKYKAVYYRDYFIFDLKSPATKTIPSYKIMPLPSHWAWDYFVSSKRKPESETLVYDEKLEQDLKIKLGLIKPPTNKYFPNGLTGLYYSTPHFKGETKPFISNTNSVAYVWVDKVAPFDLKCLPRPWGWFSLILQGQIKIPTTGKYTFSLHSDDNSKFFINEELVIESNIQPKTVTKFMPKGLYPCKLTFVEMGGGAFLDLNIQPEN